jgi:type I restriction enzyme S subunit
MLIAMSLHQRFLSQLPDDWTKVPIEKLGSVYAGGTPSRNEPSFWGGTIAWVTPAELTNLKGKWLTETKEYVTEKGFAQSAAKLLPPTSLLITTRATIGSIAIAAIPVCTNQGFKNIVPNELTDPNYYYYLFQEISPEFYRLASGSTFLEISKRDFVSIIVPRPTIDEQGRIAEALDAIDAAIQRTDTLIYKLKSIKAGLLNDLLTRGLDHDSNLRDPLRHPEQFKNEPPFGLIPRDWDYKTLKNVVLKVADRDHTTPIYVDEGIPMVSPLNFFGDEGIDFVSCKRITPIAHSINRKKTDIQYDDIIIHRIGAGLGRVRSVTLAMPEFSILHSLAMIRPDTSKVFPLYLLWALRDFRIQRQMQLGIQSIGVPDLGLDKIEQLLLPIPRCKEEQKQIADTLNSHQNMIHVEEGNREKLVQIKKGLMHDLLSGRVRVPAIKPEVVVV